MKAAAALVLGAGPEEAAAKAAEDISGALDGQPPGLVVAFATPHYARRAGLLVDALQGELGPVPLIGCVAEWVVGGGREVETGPAVSVWVAAGTGPVETFSMQYVRARGGGLFGGYRFDPGSGPHLMICDPFSFPVGELLGHLNDHVPGVTVIGGMASGGVPDRRSQLFLDRRVLTNGAVGATMAGAHIDLMVSQGCRPIGHPYTVTRAEGNVLHELGGRSPVQRLQELVGALPERDRELLANGGLHVGRVIDEYRAEQGYGDFLIRSVVGADAEQGAIVVGDEIEVGQTVQFHVRDAESADEDLTGALEREAKALGGRPAAGALLFTCNGRGSRLFSVPDHDASLVSKFLGEIPAAGIFCAGELGPVGGKNFLHAFTASIAVFR
jgi:small ligand-binding sensory domain FIST